MSFSVEEKIFFIVSEESDTRNHRPWNPKAILEEKLGVMISTSGNDSEMKVSPGTLKAPIKSLISSLALYSKASMKLLSSNSAIPISFPTQLSTLFKKEGGMFSWGNILERALSDVFWNVSWSWFSECFTNRSSSSHLWTSYSSFFHETIVLILTEW